MLKTFLVIALVVFLGIPTKMWAQKTTPSITAESKAPLTLNVPSGRAKEFVNTNYYWYENMRIVWAKKLEIASLVAGYWGLTLVVAAQMAQIVDSLVIPRRQQRWFNVLAKAQE
jgi:hypothetical protein